MSELDEIRARIPEIPEADMSRHEKDRAYLLAKIDAILALVEEAESAFGTSSYCTATTYQIREALGLDVSTWIEDVNKPFDNDKDRGAA